MRLITRSVPPMGRRTAAIATAVVACGVAAGCGGAASQNGNGPTSTQLTGNRQSAACDGTPVRGGSLVYARQLGPVTLNPFTPTNSQGDIFATSIMYQPLVQPDPKGGGKLVPAVADKWSTSSDGKTITFHIRANAKFSDGTPVTADDVKFTLDKFADPKWNIASVLADGYKGTDVVDNSTVRVHLAKPTPGFLWNIAIFDAYIIPAKKVQAEGKNAFFKHPIGSGPFMVQSWKRGSSITFVRNPFYWEKGLPYLDKVTYLYAQDDNSRLLALESGRAQMADGIPFSQVDALKARQDVEVQTAKVPYWLGLWLNHQRAPFRDLKVRQAMQYALDKDVINKKIYAGLGTIPNSILPPFIGDASSDQVKPYTTDLAKAKQLMASSKFPKGFSVTLQYPSGYATYSTLALLLQSQWQQIGIKVKLRSIDQTSESDHFFAGQYDMIFPFAQFSSDVPIPDEYVAFVGLPAQHHFFSWWKDPKIEQMVATYLHTSDEAQRTQQWHDIQQAMLTQTPALNLLNLPFVNAHTKKTCGTYLNALGADQLQYTWMLK
jgi:peptide/nickel transport system substrate-binding protein